MPTQDHNTTTSLLPVDSQSVPRVLATTAPRLALGVALSLLAACGGDENTEPDLDTGADTGADSDAGGDAVTDEGATDNGGSDESATDNGINDNGGSDEGTTDNGGGNDEGTTDTGTTDADDATDTGGDTAVEPETVTRAALVAWFGAAPSSFGSLNVSKSDGATFGPTTVWRSGSGEQPVGFGTTANLAGDFNGDGQTDLLAFYGASPSSFGALGVYVNTGSAFEPINIWRGGSAEFAVVAGSTANLVGDVNGDDNDDVIVWSGFSGAPNWGGVSVYLSNGTAFDARALWFSGTPEAVTGSGATANLAADVNGDGRDDLIAWSQATGGGSFGGVSVFLSNGTGFDAPTTWLAGSGAAAVVGGSAANLAADVNGDGCADLVAWSGFSGPPNWGAISVHESTCSAFEAATTWRAGGPESPVPTGTTLNAAADVNNDGNADLISWYGAAPPGNWGSVNVMLSNGTAFEAQGSWRAGSPEFPVAAGTTANLVISLTETPE